MQIDVIEEVKGTQFMQCKLYIDGNASVILMNKIDYERLKEEGIFIRDGKSQDSAGVLNTTNTFIEKNYKIMNSKNKQTEIKAFLSFILEQSKETGLHVSCTIMSEEDTGEGYEIFAGHVSSCKGARLHRLLYGAIAVNENFRKAVTSALLEYERTKTVNRDKMSMN